MNDSATDLDRRGADPDVPRLHVITDDRVLERPDFVDVAARITRAGPAVALHVRGPRTDGRALHRVAHRLASEVQARPAGAAAWIVVNDRVDVALAVGADGVQLGARSLRPVELPEAAARLRVGVSVHDVADIRTVEGGADGGPTAESRRVDWWIVGTIFPTASHPGREGAGTPHITEVSRATPVPTIAIGGVSPDRVGDVLAAGAHGVAVLRGVWAARDPVDAVDRYLSEIARHADRRGNRSANRTANPDSNPDQGART